MWNSRLKLKKNGIIIHCLIGFTLFHSRLSDDAKASSKSKNKDVIWKVLSTKLKMSTKIDLKSRLCFREKSILQIDLETLLIFIF